MAGSLYATIDDINVNLPEDKVNVSDGEDDLLQIDAYRLIRARLSGTFGLDAINAWVSPTTTPEIIREIAGKLIAAKHYANVVAEDEADGSSFAQSLYNEAIALLNDIRNGALTVIGIDGDDIASSVFNESSFYPNDTAPDPSFTISDTWA